MKKILCPIDFSDAANNAVEFAANLAKSKNASITFLHIEPVLIPTEEEGISALDKLKEEKENAMEMLAETTRETERRFEIKCDYELESIKLENAIARDTKEGDYDLVVMGTNGMDDVNQFYFGTNTWRAIDSTMTPILVIPESAKWKIPDTVVFASNYQEDDDLRLKQMISFLQPFDPEIEVLHISKEDSVMEKETFNAFCELVEDELEDNHKVRFRRISHENIPLAIDDYILEKKADMLAISAKHRNFLQKLIHKSVTREVSSYADYPVLIFHY